MTAILLKSDDFTVTSATNATTSKDYLVRDLLGLDTVFSNNPVIVLDRGGTRVWNTIAFVNSTISTAATVKIEYSSDSTFATGVTTLGPVSVGISNVNSARSNCHVHDLVANTNNRYIRITFANAGAFKLGRILIGTKISLDGVNIDAERTIEDMSEEYSFGAYSAFDDQPTLLGWKCGLPWMDETVFRSTFQPFLQNVGNSKCFLFIPQIDDATTVQSDWCYGRITAKGSVQHQGHNL